MKFRKLKMRGSSTIRSIGSGLHSQWPVPKLQLVVYRQALLCHSTRGAGMFPCVVSDIPHGPWAMQPLNKTARGCLAVPWQCALGRTPPAPMVRHSYGAGRGGDWEGTRGGVISRNRMRKAAADAPRPSGTRGPGWQWSGGGIPKPRAG